MAATSIRSDVELVEEPTFGLVHTLALRSSASPLPPGGELLISRGLAEPSGTGFLLTSNGYRLHRALLDRERAAIDITTFGMVYAPVAALSRRLNGLASHWREVPGDRPELAKSFDSFVSLADAPLRRAAAIVPRFESYLPRLLAADRRLREGDLRFAVDGDVDSIVVTWADLHEDYLQTLGRGHEMEAL